MMSPKTGTRRFIDPADRLDDLERIEPYFHKLSQRDLPDVAAVESWLVDCSELASCISEVRTDRYVKMTCNTNDPALGELYMQFVEEIEPQCRKRWHELNVKYASCAAARRLPTERYFVMDRSTRAAVDLYREENLPVLVRQARFAQEYQKICGQMAVVFDGEEKTLQQMGLYLEGTDRDTRRRAWEAMTQRRLEDRDKLEDVFDALLACRSEMARNANLPDYRAYAFSAYQRFDYSPDDCLRFHETIERTVLPAARSLNERRHRNLGVETLRPWDLSVDENGLPALKPFASPDELCDKCAAIFNQVAPELGRQFADMRKNHYLDLDSRKGKAPGGYQSTYEESRRPFIFMNAVGLHRDVETLLHEGGHAFHTYATRDEDLYEYRSAPIEFAEVASMSMELLAMEHLDVVYSEDDLVRAKRKQLEGILRTLPWIAVIDAFQHWLYTNEGHGRDERRDAWIALQRRFDTGVDWAGHEEAEGYRWQQQLHLYEVPFYYIEYAIAQLGALQIWQRAKRDRSDAVRRYRAALALGGSKPLPELFEAAGIRFDFSHETTAPLVDAILEELDRLGN